MKREYKDPITYFEALDRVSGIISLIDDRLGYTDEDDIEIFLSCGENDSDYGLHPAIDTEEKMKLLSDGLNAFAQLYQKLGEDWHFSGEKDSDH